MGKSHQKGWVVARGKKWYGYFRRDVIDPVSSELKSTIVPVVLGPKSQLTKFEARESLEREIAKLTGQSVGGKAVNDGSVTFGWFVGWTPRLRQPNETLFAVRCKIVDRQDHCTAF